MRTPATDLDAAHHRIDARGAALVVGAAICYALTVLFAKNAYGDGLDVASLLVWRFTFATAIFWALVAWRRPKHLARKDIRISIGLGLAGYAGQALFYFGAIASMDAGLSALVLYAYPAIVTVIALVTRHESPTRRRLLALACSALGLLLLLGLGAAGGATATGITLALCAAVTYALYTFVASRLPASADPVLIMAIVSTAALVTLLVYAFATGGVTTGSGGGLWWALAHATIGTVVAMSIHQMGLVRVGAPTAGILSSIEPVFAASMGALLWGERLSAGQLAGACLVLASVVILSLPRSVTGARRRALSGRARGAGPAASATPAALADHAATPVVEQD